MLNVNFHQIEKGYNYFNKTSIYNISSHTNIKLLFPYFICLQDLLLYILKIYIKRKKKEKEHFYYY